MQSIKTTPVPPYNDTYGGFNMRSICLLRVLPLCAIVLVTGCSRNLDIATAQPVIQQWIQQQTSSEIIASYSTPLECRQELVNKGYIKVTRPYDAKRDGPFGEPLESTEKLPKDTKVDKGWLVLPLFKAELVAVSPVHQVQGEKQATVNFSFKYVPTNPDITDVCRKKTTKDVINMYAMFTLTTNGWVGEVPRQ